MADKINYGDNGKVAREKINNIMEEVEAHLPSIGENGDWYLGETDTNVPATGNGIESITTSKSGKITTVVITETNGDSESFEISDGADGAESSGDVNGPESSVNGNVALFDGTTGKLLKDSGKTIPTVNNSKIEIQKNGTKIDEFSLNQSNGKTINITVPTKVSDLTNDSGFITSSSVPTKTSQLSNDIGFITNAVNDLTNYYKKTETYTQTEINSLISNFGGFEVVSTLPTQNIKTNVIYLKGPIGSGADKYEEYIYSNSTWILIGETSVDLTNYFNTSTQTSDNITEGSTNLFLTSAERTVLGNTSGTNTGDQSASDFDIKDLTDSTNLMSTWSGKQDTLTAGTGINISQNNEISNALPGAVVSATAPSNPSQGAMWYDTTTDTLMTYDGSQWNATGGGGSRDVVVSSQTGNVLTSGMSIWAGSQSDYENLSEYNENCLYLTIEGVDGPRTYSYDFTDKTSTQVTNDGWSALDSGTSWSVDSNGLTVTGYAGYMKKEIDNSNFSNANKITLSYHCKTTSSTSYSINVYLGDVTGSTINHSLFMNFDCRQGFRQFGYDSTEIAKVYGGTYGEHDITIVLDLVNKTYTWSLTGQTDMTGTLADAYITSIRNDFNCIGLGCYGSSIVYRDVSIEIEH